MQIQFEDIIDCVNERNLGITNDKKIYDHKFVDSDVFCQTLVTARYTNKYEIAITNGIIHMNEDNRGNISSNVKLIALGNMSYTTSLNCYAYTPIINSPVYMQYILCIYLSHLKYKRNISLYNAINAKSSSVIEIAKELHQMRTIQMYMVDAYSLKMTGLVHNQYNYEN